jgi:hypothetical protein
MPRQDLFVEATRRVGFANGLSIRNCRKSPAWHKVFKLFQARKFRSMVPFLFASAEWDLNARNCDAVLIHPKLSPRRSPKHIDDGNDKQSSLNRRAVAVVPPTSPAVAAPASGSV